MRKSWLKLFLRLFISLLLLFFFLYNVELPVVLKALREISFSNLLIAVLLLFITFFILAFKWKLLLPDRSFLLLFRYIFIGHYYSLILPGQIAGEAVKAYSLGKGKADAEKIAASVLVDKITGLIGLLLLGVFGLLWTTTVLPSTLLHGILLVTGIVILTLFCVRLNFIYQFFLTIISYLKVKLTRMGEVFTKAEGLLESWYVFSQKTQRLSLSILLGGLYQLIGIIINILLANQLGIEISFADWCWISAILSIALILPITIAGIGVREGTLVGVLAIFDVTAEKALALSLAIFGLWIFFALVGGIIDGFNSFKKSPLF